MTEIKKPFEQITIACFYCGYNMGEAYPTEVNKNSRFRCEDCRSKGITKRKGRYKGAKLSKASRHINNR